MKKFRKLLTAGILAVAIATVQGSFFSPVADKAYAASQYKEDSNADMTDSDGTEWSFVEKFSKPDVASLNGDYYAEYYCQKDTHHESGAQM